MCILILMLLDYINLRILKEKDYTDDYLTWFSDPEVIRYSQNRFKIFSKEGQLRYIRSFIKDDNKYLYGIFLEDKHIGNIELNQIDNVKLTGSITYMIGYKKYWGKGIGSFCVKEVIKKAKLEFGLKKITSGCVSKNFNSAKVLRKNGFKLESKKKFFCRYDKKSVDYLIFTKNI